MGILYRAYDTVLEGEVAVKVLHTCVVVGNGQARLLREAQAAAKLNRPNIVSIDDAGKDESVPFISSMNPAAVSSWSGLISSSKTECSS